MTRRVGIVSVAQGAGAESKENFYDLAYRITKELVVGTVRFSLGRDNTEEEIERTGSILKALVEKRRILAELEGSVEGRGCR
jgi:cysteine sulfinate desulfinase/cysteine desulfurase-like protein